MLLLAVVDAKLQSRYNCNHQLTVCGASKRLPGMEGGRVVVGPTQRVLIECVLANWYNTLIIIMFVIAYIINILVIIVHIVGV